jgi:hypothetical protein
LSGSGSINGDVIAGNTITATNVVGQKYQFAAAPITFPPLLVADFQTDYYIDSSLYSIPLHAGGNYQDQTWGSDAGNPAGIHYCNGNTTFDGGMTVNGFLVVNGDLQINGINNIITAQKNFPALLVTGKLDIAADSDLTINGLAQINGTMEFAAGTNMTVSVFGGLFIASGGIVNAIDPTISVNIASAPSITSIQIWLESGVPTKWKPAADAFYKSIQR